MTQFAGTASRSILTSLLVFGMTSCVAWAEDLSRYRDFQFGADVPSVAKLTGALPSQIKVVDSRPALIQEIAWRPRTLGSTSNNTESVQEVAFTFYNGKLYRIVANYDRYETEGLTADDMVDAISKTYGSAKLLAPAPATPGGSGDAEEVLAQWQDSQYRFDLMRSSYGPTFRLVGVLKKLEAPAEAAAAEARRLDVQEAPERDAARAASEAQEAQAKLDKARLVNKPKFRP
jgi:hypothetical protein